MSTAIPLVTQLSSRVIRVLGCNPGHMTLQGTNTYIIGTGSRRILLDTGDKNNSDYIELLKNVLDEKKIGLQRIIVTHWHHDHVGGIGGIVKNIKLDDCLLQKYPLKEQDDQLPTKYSYIKDNEEICTEGATLRFYHTPGHTEDHLVAILNEENALFSGDCILGEGTAVFENLRKYMNSLQVILSMNPSVIYPGHGPAISEPVQKIKEYISHRIQREADILAALPTTTQMAVSIESLVDKVYKIPDILKPAAGVNVGHHLSKLIEESKIETTEVKGEQRYYRRGS